MSDLKCEGELVIESEGRAVPITQRDRGNDGGDVIFTTVFQTGAGESASEHVRQPGEPGAFIFRLGSGAEVLRITCAGEVLVRGNKVADDVELYRAFRAWLETATTHHEPGAFIAEG